MLGKSDPKLLTVMLTNKIQIKETMPGQHDTNHWTCVVNKKINTMRVRMTKEKEEMQPFFC
jgi:hypothetical protein